MKRVILIGAIGLLLVVGGCANLGKIGQDACQGEITAHGIYVQWIAPFRTAEQVANELAFYNAVVAACNAGASETKINAAAAKADAARL